MSPRTEPPEGAYRGAECQLFLNWFGIGIARLQQVFFLYVVVRGVTGSAGHVALRVFFHRWVLMTATASCADFLRRSAAITKDRRRIAACS